MPVRIQRRRQRGWRMPEGVINVGRPSRWGNPYRVGALLPLRSHTGMTLRHEIADRVEAVAWYRRWLVSFPDVPLSVEARRAPPSVEEIRTALAGKDLACWCPLEDADGQRVPCHADILLAIAAGEAP